MQDWEADHSLPPSMLSAMEVTELVGSDCKVGLGKMLSAIVHFGFAIIFVSFRPISSEEQLQ